MSLDLAIDQLLDTGWSMLDTNDHEYAPSGRLFPTPALVQRAFQEAGFELEITRVDLFDCFRAAWTDADGNQHAVVGSTREEAAVYALVRLRRSQPATAGASA